MFFMCLFVLKSAREIEFSENKYCSKAENAKWRHWKLSDVIDKSWSLLQAAYKKLIF